MVRIRLNCVGAKKQRSYRIIVTEQRTPRDGRFLEIIGHYDPRNDPPAINLKEDRALYWLSHGAQPSEAVARMFDQMGVMAKLQDAKAAVKAEAQSEAA